MAIRPPRAGFSVSRRMSERARAGESPGEAGIGGLFSGLRGALEEFSRTLDLGGEKARMVFGYTVRIGPDGIDAEPFGHVPPAPDSPAPDSPAPDSPAKPAPALQPIVEVYQDGDSVVVVAELPGAAAEAIVCRPEGNKLLIETTGARHYRKELTLPVPVRAEGVRQTYQNGILEVRLPRAGAA